LKEQEQEQELNKIFLTVYNGGKGPGRRHRNKPRLALHTGHTVLILFMQIGTQVQVIVILLRQRLDEGRKANFRCRLQFSCLLRQRVDEGSKANFRCRFQSSCLLRRRLDEGE
jgi:hypothetical protein